MKKFLVVFVTVFIVLPLVIVFVFLKTLDLNKYKPQIESLANKYTNLNVKINGDIDVGISLKPTLVMNNVYISKADENNTKIADISDILIKISVLPLLEKQVVIDTVKTDATKIYYSDNDYAELNDLQISMENYNSPITLNSDINVTGQNINVSGTISSLSDIQKSNYNEIHGDINVSSSGYNLEYNGNIKDLTANITAEGDYKLSYKANSANGKISFNMANKLPYINLTVNSDNINIQDFTTEKTASDNLFISNAEALTFENNVVIPYQYLQMANANLSMNIKNINIDTSTNLSDVVANSSLKNGVLITNIKNISLGNGNVSGKIVVSAKNQKTDINLSGKNIVVQDFAKYFAQNDNPYMYIKTGGLSNFSVNVSLRGKDLNQYLQTINGQIIAFMDKSVVKVSALTKLQGNILSQILDNLQIDVKNKELNLKCAVVRADIANGIAEFPKGLVFDSNDFYLTASGKVNLQNDKLDFEIKPFSGQLSNTNVSSVISSLLRVRGSIYQPKLSINKEEATKSVIEAIASGGIYNIGDMMLSSDSSPCYTALRGTAYSNYFEGESNIKTGVKNTYNDTKEAVKDLGNQAKNLFNKIVK